MLRTLTVAVASALTLAMTAGMALATPDAVIVSANPADSTPHVDNGFVKAIAEVGTKVVVAGSFTSVHEPGGPTIPRKNIFAFDTATGKIDPTFVPAVNGLIEEVVQTVDGHVVVAGRFTIVNGAPRRGLAKLDLATGQTIPTFSATTDGDVYDVKASGSRLFVGGAFSRVSGQLRSKLAAVDALTGAVDPGVNFTFSEPRATSKTWSPVSVTDVAVSPDGSRLVAIGSFGRVNGVSRHQIAVFDISQSPATLANWSTNRYQPYCKSIFPAYLRDVDFHPDGAWFAVVTSGGYGWGTLCDTVARWNIRLSGSGLQPTWVDSTGGDSLLSVEVTRAAVYTGGHERWHNNPFGADRAGPGAVPREGIGALDTVTGLPLSWNPGRARGAGVQALVATASGLWVGSDTTTLAREFHARLGFFPAIGGKAVPTRTTGALPGHLYKAGLTDTLTRQVFDGTTVGPSSTVTTGSPAWSQARGTYLVTGELFSGWSDGRMYVRSFDGTNLGAAASVPLYGLESTNFPVRSVTGMFFDAERSRVYFTVSGDPNLYWRWFTNESRIFGAERFVAGSSGIDWRVVRGMTLASGRIYYADSNGDLRSIAFANGAPVAGTATVVSRRVDGRDWRSNGLFVTTP